MPAEYSWDHVLLPAPPELLSECFSESAEQEAAAVTAALFFALSMPSDGISAVDDLELHDPMALRWKIVRQVNQKINYSSGQSVQM